VSATRQGADRDLLTGFAPTRQVPAEVPEAGLDRTTLETTIALLADHTRPFALEAPVAVEPAENPNPDRFRRVYRATSAVLTSEFSSMLGLTAGNLAWGKEDWAHYLQVPGDPRYQELAQEVIERLPEELREDAMLKAWTVRDWLGAEGTYSLRSQHSDAADPTAHFLFGDKTGYCVHFAHAAVYMMRALGVPARVATGYAVDEASRQGGSALLITSGSAHAWPEIFLQDVGWVVVDVQPEQTLDPPVQPPDADLQRLLGQLARGARVLPSDGSPPPETFAVLWRWLKSRLATGAWVALLGFLTLTYGIKVWRALVPHWGRRAALPRTLYRAELDRLSEVGVSRQRGESREAFARRMEASLPSLGPLTQAHLAAAFGSRRSVEPATLRAHARALRRELRGRAPVHRRVLGWLTPWSWWASR
jgi:transglutaminase-like putative cysteine protease